MATFVTKKDGTKVPFDAEKIKSSIVAAATDAGLSEQEAASIAGETAPSVVADLEGTDEVSSREIREKILAELDASFPAIAKAWRDYEASKGK